MRPNDEIYLRELCQRVAIGIKQKEGLEIVAAETIANWLESHAKSLLLNPIADAWQEIDDLIAPLMGSSFRLSHNLDEHFEATSEHIRIWNAVNWTLKDDVPIFLALDRGQSREALDMMIAGGRRDSDQIRIRKRVSAVITTMVVLGIAVLADVLIGVSPLEWAISLVIASGIVCLRIASFRSF
ncbi:MAG: hypothetical protein M0020_01420 [Actinomycetota bacterium]|nr:hypothetical protein [Actinomycetota bacterium]